jgi:hypothetical protein
MMDRIRPIPKRAGAPIILTPHNREAICQVIRETDDGYVVQIRPRRRSLDQNAALHGYCAQIAKARPEWAGMPMAAEDWKALLVEGHAKATGQGGARLVMSLEGNGLIQLRESTATMSRARASSLIEYVQAWAAQQGITLERDDAP